MFFFGIYIQHIFYRDSVPLRDENHSYTIYYVLSSELLSAKLQIIKVNVIINPDFFDITENAPTDTGYQKSDQFLLKTFTYIKEDH